MEDDTVEAAAPTLSVEHLVQIAPHYVLPLLSLGILSRDR